VWWVETAFLPQTVVQQRRRRDSSMKKPMNKATRLEPILKMILKFKGKRFLLD
jgi:hypothetical protein